MKIVYCHNREVLSPYTMWFTNGVGHYTINPSVNPRGGSTVAMESIPTWLLDQLQQGDTIVRKIGIARCSKDDNYNKKKGRELAFSRLKQKTLTVVNIVPISGVVFFEDEDDNLYEVKKSGDPQCAILVRMLDD